MTAVITPTYTGTFPLGLRKDFAELFTGTRTKKPVDVVCTYVIKCEATGHVYVGATKQFYRRWSGHQRLLANGQHTNHELQELYNRHGEDSFTISIAQHLDSTQGLEHHEEEAAAEFEPASLLNFRIGNTCKKGWKPSDHAGLRPYTPKVKRGPNSVSRWFDFTGRSHA